MNEFIPKNLPLEIDIETKTILKKSITANKALAKLNGVATIICPVSPRYTSSTKLKAIA